VVKQLREDPELVEKITGIGVNVKNWQPGIYREGTLIQHHTGQIFKALVDTSAEPGKGEDQDDWERIGSGGFRWMGVKDETKTYRDGDMFIDGGSTFCVFDGKAKMVARRGKDGQNGKDGKDGKDGQSAPKPVHFQIDSKSVNLVLEDGTVLEGDAEPLFDVFKQMSWLETQLTGQLVDDNDAPIKRYAGTYKLGEDYAIGEVVTSEGGLFLCYDTDKNTTGTSVDKWVKLAGVGGGGGSGGGGSGVARMSTLIVDSLLNMQGRPIQGVANPRPGVVGSQDATNKQYVDQAIAAGALYQGIYTVATNAPDLGGKTDSGFTPPAPGDVINAPPSNGFTPGAANVTTWHNWRGNGFDIFGATTTAPTPLSVMLSDGRILTHNIDPGTYADEAALIAHLEAQFTEPEVAHFYVYVNGADCWIGVETVGAKPYCTAISDETGNAFPAATIGPANSVLNTYNWIVQSRDPNTPEALPPGIPGLAAGTIVKNSDVLQYSGTKQGFEIISGSSLTQSFSDQRYWQIKTGNMTWQDQDYNQGAVVYSTRHNAWFVSTQRIRPGTLEPGGNPGNPPGAEWRKINSTYGSTVFFGRGEYDSSDTTAGNNFGMPQGTYPGGQQPLNGDSYFDVLTGATTNFTVVSNPPVYTLPAGLADDDWVDIIHGIENISGVIKVELIDTGDPSGSLYEFEIRDIASGAATFYPSILAINSTRNYIKDIAIFYDSQYWRLYLKVAASASGKPYRIEFNSEDVDLNPISVSNAKIPSALAWADTMKMNEQYPSDDLLNFTKGLSGDASAALPPGQTLGVPAVSPQLSTAQGLRSQWTIHADFSSVPAADRDWWEMRFYKGAGGANVDMSQAEWIYKGATLVNSSNGSESNALWKVENASGDIAKGYVNLIHPAWPVDISKVHAYAELTFDTRDPDVALYYLEVRYVSGGNYVKLEGCFTLKKGNFSQRVSFYPWNGGYGSKAVPVRAYKSS